MRPFDSMYRPLAFVAIVILALIGGGFLIAPFLPAILWATVLTVLTKPIYNWFNRRYSESASAALTTVSTLLIIGVPLVLIGAAMFVQVNGFVKDMENAAPGGQHTISPELILGELDRSLKPMIEQLSPNFSFVSWFEQNRDQLTRTISAPAGQALQSISFTLLTLVVSFLTMFFMLRDGHRLEQPAIEILPISAARSREIFERMAATIRAVFIGVVLVALIQGSVAMVTYALVGVPHWLMWGVATIVLCMIPLMGAPIVYIPLALILFSQGNTWGAIILLIVGFGIVSQVDNLLRPWIIGLRVQLHWMAIFFSLLGGILWLGPVGIMAGPLLLTVLLALQDIVREARNGQKAVEPVVE